MNSSRRFENNKMPTIALSLTIGAVLLGGGIASVIDYNQGVRKTKVDRTKIDDQLQKDGFEISGEDDIYWVNDSDAHLALNLGNCSIDAVGVKVERDSEGTIIDVDNYSFSGYAMSATRTGQHHSGLGTDGRMRQYTDGAPVTFTFDNYTSLKNNILGPEPCKTLASSVTPR